MSRRAIDRANAALEGVLHIGIESEVPIILLNTSLPLGERWMQSKTGIIYAESSAYLDAPFMEFLRRATSVGMGTLARAET